jgi:hypothetical protein
LLMGGGTVASAALRGPWVHSSPYWLANYESYELSIGLRTVKADSYAIPTPFIDSFRQICPIEDAAIPRRRKAE